MVCTPMTATQLKNINTVWQQGTFDAFKGVDGIRIQYAYFMHSTASPSIVISSGRSESYLKYKESICELYHHGYNIFILDHRGQGLSERMLSNKNKGYVKNFDDYAYDLHQFITTIVQPKINQQPYLLAHSMGGAISVRMLQLYPSVVKKATLLAPMIAINTGALPQKLAIGLVKLGKKINQQLTKEPWYFLGQSSYRIKPFHENRLTHSQKRYKTFAELYQTNTEIQLGGATYDWLYQAIEAEKNIFTQLDKIQTPLCILQAGNDTIVDNNKQQQFCAQLHHISPELCAQSAIVIEQAFHELLFEEEAIRTKAVSHILSYFAD